MCNFEFYFKYSGLVYVRMFTKVIKLEVLSLVLVYLTHMTFILGNLRKACFV